MELWPSDKHRLAYTTSLLIFQYCLPLLLVLLCYLRIFLRLRRRRSNSFAFTHSVITWFIHIVFNRPLCDSMFVLSCQIRALCGHCVWLRCELMLPEVCYDISWWIVWWWMSCCVVQGHAGAQQEDSRSPEDKRNAAGHRHSLCSVLAATECLQHSVWLAPPGPPRLSARHSVLCLPPDSDGLYLH